jgi:hypothetical protein
MFALLRAAQAAIGDGPPTVPGATPRNTAQQISSQTDKTNPPEAAGKPGGKQRRPLAPKQLTAARLLLEGRSVSETAGMLRVHPYTVSRWKRNPRFQDELQRQVNRTISAAPRNTAQQKPTTSCSPAQNEPNGRGSAPGYIAPADRAILAFLPKKLT